MQMAVSSTYFQDVNYKAVTNQLYNFRDIWTFNNYTWQSPSWEAGSK